MKTAFLLVIITSLVQSGCATTSQSIQATYVSPMTYASHDCTQLSLEADRISRRVSELTGQIDKRASDDQGQAAVAIILFWPALFFLGDNDAQNAELSKLKGEAQAIEANSISKKCLALPSSSTTTSEEVTTPPAVEATTTLTKPKVSNNSDQDVVNSELVFWQSIATSKTCADYQAYSSSFPNGTFIKLARARETQYCQQNKLPATTVKVKPNLNKNKVYRYDQDY